MMRSLGAVIASLGIALAVFAADGALAAKEMAARFAIVQAERGDSFNAERWIEHWTVASVELILIGCGALIAGALLVSLRRMGYLVLAATCTLAAVVPWILGLSGYSIYAFERASAWQSLLFVLFASGSVLAYRLSEARVRA